MSSGPTRRRGRPTLPPDQKKGQRTVTFMPETLRWLDSRVRGAETIGQVIDRLVIRAMSANDPTEYDE